MTTFLPVRIMIRSFYGRFVYIHKAHHGVMFISAQTIHPTAHSPNVNLMNPLEDLSPVSHHSANSKTSKSQACKPYYLYSTQAKTSLLNNYQIALKNLGVLHVELM